MKKIVIVTILIAGATFVACKKDRTCECTETKTNAAGVSTTDPVVTYEIKEIKGGEAKTWCQKSTEVVTTGTAVTTTVNDCKLK